MIDIQDLKQFVILEYLSDEMLKKLVPITETLLFDKNEKIFQQGDKADRFFLLKKGKVLLELRITDNITVSMSGVKPGFSFNKICSISSSLSSESLKPSLLKILIPLS